jgi:hypothetical protein
MKLQIIGDDIHADGVMVARMCEGLPATLEGEAREIIDGADSEDKIDVRYLVEQIKKRAKGGLIRLSELEEVLDVCGL